MTSTTDLAAIYPLEPALADPHIADSAVSAPPTPDISVVMPCLNEEESVAHCVALALEGIRRSGLTGEVIVCDNGSTDRSVELAAAAGARVVHQPRRGYGSAYRKGFDAARGRFLVMGDSDGSYDFSELHKFIAPIEAGNDYVLGSRFGGQILPGAMPWSHRYIGNPVLTGILNLFFKLDVSDAHSGMRAFSRDAYERMGLATEGMEFASEIVISAARHGLKVAEVPITYHPRIGESKLHSLRDGWRHLRFMLLLSPKFLFFVPGILLFLVGMLGQSLLLPGPLDLGFHSLGIHFSALFALCAVLGYQSVLFGLFTKAFTRLRMPNRQDRLLDWVDRDFTLERGLVAGGLVFVGGLVIDVVLLVDWLGSGLAAFNAMPEALFAMSLMMIGAQTAFGAFFLSLLADRGRVGASS
jgi:glycosyltransferase involved in cell wall biosynthesis